MKKIKKVVKRVLTYAFTPIHKAGLWNSRHSEILFIPLVFVILFVAQIPLPVYLIYIKLIILTPLIMILNSFTHTTGMRDGSKIYKKVHEKHFICIPKNSEIRINIHGRKIKKHEKVHN